MEQQFFGISMEEAKKLAQSDTFRQLMTLLQHTDGLENAMQQAGTGNLAAAKQTMASLLSDPQAAALLQRLQEERHG